MYNVLITEISDLTGYDNKKLNVEVDASLANRPDELIRRAAGKHALVVRNMTKVHASLIGRLRDSTTIRVIGRLGVGLDNVDVIAARRAGFEVVYTPDANTESVAQYVVGQILLVTRRLSAAHESTARGEWNRLSFMGRQLSELTVGIVGFGRIGARVADIVSSLGSRIVAFDTRPGIVPAQYVQASLTDVFSSADVISIHVPLTEATRGFFGFELISLMRPNAILINSSRGEVIRESDLETVLRSRPDVSAVLDVRSSEPPADRLFHDLANVRLSPHIAAFTTAAQKQVLSTVLDDVERVLSGGQPLWPAP